MQAPPGAAGAAAAPPAPAAAPAKRTVLSDRFLIGEELGRGAYGQVFKGMDAQTGDVVAIKQIPLGGVSQENLASVMGEIDLLKTLNHKNIVKYIGSFKTRAHLYIILEYMENGSLASVIKPSRFGAFPEPLAAVYTAQVLRGLAYLHEQGVVHRDIKGANILTTKEVRVSVRAAWAQCLCRVPCVFMCACSGNGGGALSLRCRLPLQHATNATRPSPPFFTHTTPPAAQHRASSSSPTSASPQSWGSSTAAPAPTAAAPRPRPPTRSCARRSRARRTGWRPRSSR